MNDSYGNTAKKSRKDAYLTNPVTITLGVLLLTFVVTHVADYFINVALNKDTVWGMYSYGLPLVAKIILFLLFLFITLSIRSHKTTNFLSDKDLCKKSFGSTPVSVAIVILIVSGIGSNAIYRLIKLISDRSLNYGLHSLEKITTFEIYIFLAWFLICLFYFFTNKSVGNVVLGVLSIATAYAAFHFLIVIDALEKIKSGATFKEYVEEQLIQNIVEEAGIGKVLALTSLAENAMSIVYKAVFYIAVIITLLNFRILSKRSQKKIAVIMSEAAAIVVAVLLLISFTPLTDIITTALAALLK